MLPAKITIKMDLIKLELENVLKLQFYIQVLIAKIIIQKI